MDLLDPSVELVDMVLCVKGIRAAKPWRKVRRCVDKRCLQTRDGDLLPCAQMGDDFADRPFSRARLSCDFLLAHTGQERFPAVEYRRKAADHLLFIPHYALR